MAIPPFKSDPNATGQVAFNFQGNNVVRANVPAISGIPSLSISFRYKDTAPLPHDNGVMNLGSFGSHSISNSCISQQATGSSDGSSTLPTNVIRWKAKRSTGNTNMQSPGGVQTTQWTILHGNSSATDLKMWLNAVSQVGVKTYVAGGTVELPASELNIGTGPLDSRNGSFRGLVDYYRAYAGDFTQDYVDTEVLNQTYPDEFIGVGDFDSPTDATPSPVAIPLTVGPVIYPGNVTIDLKARGYVPNKPGTVLSFDAPTYGTCSVVSDKLRYAPNNGVTDIEDTFKAHLDIAGKRSTSIIRVQVAPSALLRVWDFDFPNRGQYTLDRIVMWPGFPNTPVPTHNVGDLIVPYNDGSTITTEYSLLNNIKGPILLSGFRFAPTGVHPGVSTNPTLGIRSTIRVVFDSTARPIATWKDEPAGVDRNWCYFFFANCSIDFEENNAQFGDTLRIGQGGAQPNDASHQFQGPKSANIWNQIRIDKGQHYVSNFQTPLPTGWASSENGHSDTAQSFGGIPVYRVANSFLTVCGNQGFFSGREAGAYGWPRSTRWKFKNVTWEHLPPWAPNAASHATNIHPLCVDCTEQQAESRGENYDYATGKYMGVNFENCYYRGQQDATSANWSNYIAYGAKDSGGVSVVGGTGLDANRYYRWKTSAQGDHSWPAFSGDFKYCGPTQHAEAPDFCPLDRTGPAYMFTSREQVLAAIS